MQIKARAKYLRISPKKMRLVVDVIRGMDVSEAFDYLQFVPKKAAHFILKTLQSAVANAEHNLSLKKDNLVIKKIVVDQGPVLKRWRARAFGRAAPIRKRSSHLSVVLEEKESAISAAPRKEKLKAPVVQPLTKEKHEPTKAEQKEKGIPKQKEQRRVKKILDIRRKGKKRTKQHLDKIRTKKKGGGIKKVFRRKSI